MSGVNELADLLRKYASHRTFAAPKKTWEEAVVEAADVLETLHADNRDLVQHCAGRLEAAQMWQARAMDAESRLAKMAPVVEAARKAVTAWFLVREPEEKEAMRELREALATLEADHD